MAAKIQQKGVTQFVHDQEARLADLDPPELRNESPAAKAARVREALASGETTWTGGGANGGAGRGGWQAQHRGDVEFWGYGDRPHTGMS